MNYSLRLVTPSAQSLTTILKGGLLIAATVYKMLKCYNLDPTRTALKHRSEILSRSLSENENEVKIAEENIWGEGVKIVQKCKPNRKPFTQAEKEDFVAKYESGMSMGAIAREYDCNHVTVGRILRRMGVEIR